MTGHEKNGDRFRGQGVALGLEHVDPNHHGSGVDHAVDLLPEDVLDLILPVDEEEVQQYVLAEVDHDHGLRLVVDLLVLEAADVMGITIGHLHMDPLEGILESIATNSTMPHLEITTHRTAIHLWVHKVYQ